MHQIFAQSHRTHVCHTHPRIALQLRVWHQARVSPQLVVLCTRGPFAAAALIATATLVHGARMAPRVLAVNVCDCHTKPSDISIIASALSLRNTTPVGVHRRYRCVVKALHLLFAASRLVPLFPRTKSAPLTNPSALYENFLWPDSLASVISSPCVRVIPISVLARWQDTELIIIVSALVPTSSGQEGAGIVSSKCIVRFSDQDSPSDKTRIARRALLHLHSHA